MKRRLGRICVSVAMVIAIFGWWFWPQLHFHYALAHLSVNASGVPFLRGVSQDALAVNTYEDHVSSKVVAELYYAGCDRLEKLRGNYPRRTYHWYDLEGWDRVTSVVQFPASYLSVTAACNNDNDSVAVRVLPGTFPPPDHSPAQFIELKELPNDRLPLGTLRFQQRKDN